RSSNIVATRSIADQGAADLTRRRDPPPSDFPPWQVTSLKQVICGGAVGQTGLTRDRARAPNWAVMIVDFGGFVGHGGDPRRWARRRQCWGERVSIRDPRSPRD